MGGYSYFLLFLLLSLARVYFSLCLHMYKISDLVFKVVFGFAVTIVVFSSKHKSQYFAPGWYGTPFDFIDHFMLKPPASKGASPGL